MIHTAINGDGGMIQATINFTYERQLSYREKIAVGCRIPRIGNKTWHRAAHGITTMVAFDFQTNTTNAVPDQWRHAIPAYEKGPQRIYS